MTISAAEQSVIAAIGTLLTETATSIEGARVQKLRSLHEQAARLAMGVGTGDLLSQLRGAIEAGIAQENLRRAIDHLASAEGYESELGSSASGSGEGLSSMRNVHELRLARASLLSLLIDAEPEALAQSLALVSRVESAANSAAADFTMHLSWLRTKLAPNSIR